MRSHVPGAGNASQALTIRGPLSIPGATRASSGPAVGGSEHAASARTHTHHEGTRSSISRKRAAREFRLTRRSSTRSAMSNPLVLSYAGCSTCKKALAWLGAHGVGYTLRAIVDAPPTPAELARWIPASGLPVRKWLNTSGQSYRAIGKERI